MLFRKKPQTLSYDHDNMIPMIKASICNGEQVAGFRNVNTGAFEEVMLIRDDADLDEFCSRYAITGKIEKFY